MTISCQENCYKLVNKPENGRLIAFSLNKNMLLLNQYDQRWTNILMMPSKLTLGRYGCTTTSICWLSAYFKCFVLPPQAVDQNIKYTKDGLVIWESINFPTFKFEKRLKSCSLDDIDLSLKDPRRAVILNINHGAHWVGAVRKGLFGGYVVMDPFGGYARTIKTSEIVGSAHFIAK